jgi:protein SCO1/2
MVKKTLLVGVLSLLVIAITAAGVWMFGSNGELRGTAYAEPYPPAPEFDLTSGNGTDFRLSAMRGKIVLLFFGYTSCPDVCPTTMAELKAVTDKLGAEEAKNVQVVLVSVDPGRDTPQRIQEYVNHFSKDFIGLTGPEPVLAKVWSDYGIFRQIVDEQSAAGYGIDHTARITLIDQDGNLRASYGFDTPVDDIVHDLKLLQN